LPVACEIATAERNLVRIETILHDQSSGLSLQLFQSLCLIAANPAILLTPAVVSAVRHADLDRQLSDEIVSAVCEQMPQINIAALSMRGDQG